MGAFFHPNLITIKIYRVYSRLTVFREATSNLFNDARRFITNLGEWGGIAYYPLPRCRRIYLAKKACSK